MLRGSIDYYAGNPTPHRSAELLSREERSVLLIQLSTFDFQAKF